MPEMTGLKRGLLATKLPELWTGCHPQHRMTAALLRWGSSGRKQHLHKHKKPLLVLVAVHGWSFSYSLVRKASSYALTASTALRNTYRLAQNLVPARLAGWPSMQGMLQMHAQLLNACDDYISIGVANLTECLVPGPCKHNNYNIYVTHALMSRRNCSLAVAGCQCQAGCTDFHFQWHSSSLATSLMSFSL